MGQFVGGNMLTGMVGDVKVVPNLISYFIDKKTMIALFYNCMRLDIADNNVKAELCASILGSEFSEIGTGTNRIAFLHNGVVVKVALDRRGLVDNFQEFKRSTELPNYLAKTYETNYLINICEYIEVMDQDRFLINESGIKHILEDLSRSYLFDDIGFSLKNSYNWGCREARLTPEEREYYDEDDVEYLYDICILDYGYLYPLHDQKDKLLRCPKCQHKLKWNSAYTSLGCTNSQCNFQTTPMNLRRKMNLDYEEMENKLITSLGSLKMPNLAKIEQTLSNITLQAE